MLIVASEHKITLTTTMSIHITPAQVHHAESLLEFERQNRHFFEQWVHSRTDAYYQLEHVRDTLRKAELERSRDQSAQYLIWENTQLIGRVNLTNIIRSHYNKASLGYRMAQQASGRGYASAAVHLALHEAFNTLKLWRVEAVVRPQNPGSVRVLEKNGFNLFGRSTCSVKLHGEWQDLLHFERNAK